jgi:glycosyltransferase involved in cell wall biosynthesis
LIFIDHYLPGFKVGGPVRSIEGMVNALGPTLDIRIVCRDRDLGDRMPYQGVCLDHWNTVGNAQVLYLSWWRCNPLSLHKIIRGINPDVVHLNSLFSLRFTLAPLLAVIGLPRQPKLVLAPRGSLDVGALAISPMRKRMYLSVVRALGLLRHVTWHATSVPEQEAIRLTLGNVTIAVAPNLAPVGDLIELSGRRKAPGELRLVYLSRISPKKNLLFLMDRLRALKGRIELQIIGPLEDRAYFRVCQETAASLPGSIRVSFLGPVAPSDVLGHLSRSHVFALPTLGENFGHAIVEALTAGCIVMVSDRTPWQGLDDADAGWAISLEEPKRWTMTLQYCVDMDDSKFQHMSASAQAYISVANDKVSAAAATLALLKGLPR